jgi:peptidoglycan-N-acetylmuramic acid deacetylase
MPTLSIEKMVKEVMGLHDYVKEHFGYEMSLFRPPMGEYSKQSLAVLHNLGYKSVEWSFAYYDYDVKKQPEPAKALEKVVSAGHSGGIFLLHAVSKTNAEILGDVIDEFRQQGLNLALFS